MLGIELDPAAGLDVNDFDDTDTGPNQGQNYPLLASAASNGTAVRITGSLDGPLSSYFRIEFFANSVNDPEGARYLGYVNVATDGTSTNPTFDVTLQAAVAAGEYVTATATRANSTYTTYFDTSEFSATRSVSAAAGSTISGTLWEDVDGDADVALGDGTQRIAGATVQLWADFFGTPSYVTTTTTDANGNYAFIGLANGAYGVVVDSKTIAPAAGFNPTFDQTDVWAEQTYATVGGAYWDGAAIAYLATAGALYGGTNLPNGGLSDDLSTPMNFEHVTRVDALGGTYAGVDFGFSFSAVTNTRGDNTDDDTTRAGVQQQGTLRQFILNSNAIAGVQTSNFSIGTGAQTITPTAALPPITDATILDATTQEGFGGTPLIVLDGNNLGGNALTLTASADGSTIRGFVIRDFGGDGIRIDAGSTGNVVAGNYIGRLTPAGGDAGAGEGNGGDGIEVRGSGNTIGGSGANDGNVISGNTGYGVYLQAALSNTILGNYIGLDAAGTGAIANGFSGISLGVGSDSNTIGGTGANDGNVISGNTGSGIHIDVSDGNVVLGNYVGVNASGNTALGNGAGIVIQNSSGNTVGGTTAAERNVLSGNAGLGITLDNLGTTGNVISGNYIGVGADGTTAVGNTNNGIRVVNGAADNTIGGTAAGAGNLVSNNQWGGIYLIDGGTAGAGNRILGNVSFSNPGDQGITLQGFAGNDGTRTAGEANLWMDTPVFTSANLAGTLLTVSGRIGTTAGDVDFANSRVELFKSNASGDGTVYLGFLNTGANGDFSGTIDVTGLGLAGGNTITGTATDPAGNTSEYGANFSVTAVNAPPDAVNDAYTVTHDTTLATAAGWWNASWGYRRAIAIDNPTSSALTDFPLRIRLDATFDYAKAKADGSDLRFVDADGVTVLTHQIESWNPGGDSYIWVKVPSVAIGADSITMYYGNAAAAAPGSGTGVWSNGYRAVYQFGADPGAAGPVPDLAGNGLDGDNVNAVFTTAGHGERRRARFQPGAQPDLRLRQPRPRQLHQRRIERDLRRLDQTRFTTGRSAHRRRQHQPRRGLAHRDRARRRRGQGGLQADRRRRQRYRHDGRRQSRRRQLAPRRGDRQLHDGQHHRARERRRGRRRLHRDLHRHRPAQHRHERHQLGRGHAGRERDRVRHPLRRPHGRGDDLDGGAHRRRDPRPLPQRHRQRRRRVRGHRRGRAARRPGERHRPGR